MEKLQSAVLSILVMWLLILTMSFSVSHPFGRNGVGIWFTVNWNDSDIKYSLSAMEDHGKLQSENINMHLGGKPNKADEVEINQEERKPKSNQAKDRSSDVHKTKPESDMEKRIDENNKGCLASCMYMKGRK